MAHAEEPVTTHHLVHCNLIAVQAHSTTLRNSSLLRQHCTAGCTLVTQCNRDLTRVMRSGKRDGLCNETGDVLQKPRHCLLRTACKLRAICAGAHLLFVFLSLSCRINRTSNSSTLQAALIGTARLE